MERIQGWTLFSWRGVAVKLHISLILLLFYIVLIAVAQFPFVVLRSGVNPEAVVGSPALWALLFAVSLVLSIVIHEFSHVLMAQHRGYKTKSIILMMLGGVSQVELPPDKPIDEFKIAIIGPLVSLFIGALLFAMGALSKSPSFYFYCYWVGQTNIALGIFNLIPAFPTDGGRVLRAALMARYGRLDGTRKAVIVSRIFAWALGILGFLQFNLLLMLVAFFIYGAAKSELFIVIGQTLLKDMKLKDLVIPVEGISEHATVHEAVRKMLDAKSLILPTIGENQSFGLISAQDIKTIPRQMWFSTTVKEIATISPKNFTSDEPVDHVLMYVFAHPYGALPIIENGQLLGLITAEKLTSTIQLQGLVAIESPLEKLRIFSPRHA